VEVRADLYREGGDGAEFDVEHALQSARAAVALVHSRELAHVLFTVRSDQEGGKCPSRHILQLLQLGFRMGCEIVDIEANMCSDTRTALLHWLQNHFGTSFPSSRITAILCSVHVTNPAVCLHDPHICARSLAAAAACAPAPHALKFAAVVTDEVASARMQQQAQQAIEIHGLPVCCVAMGGSGSSSIAAISRLHCATLTFCRPQFSVTPTAQGRNSSLQHVPIIISVMLSLAGQLTIPSLRLLQLRLNLHPLQQHRSDPSRPLRLFLFGCVLSDFVVIGRTCCCCSDGHDDGSTDDIHAVPRSRYRPLLQYTTLPSRFVLGPHVLRGGCFVLRCSAS
jgi:3-dehydroquinate dehydratase